MFAQIWTNSQNSNLGGLNNKEAAASAYDQSAIKLGRKLNFGHSACHRSRQSKYHGITRLKTGKWQVQISVDGTNEYLGTFKDEVEAAHAFDRRAIELGRQPNFAQPNRGQPCSDKDKEKDEGEGKDRQAQSPPPPPPSHTHTRARAHTHT